MVEDAWGRRLLRVRAAQAEPARRHRRRRRAIVRISPAAQPCHPRLRGSRTQLTSRRPRPGCAQCLAAARPARRGAAKLAADGGDGCGRRAPARRGLLPAVLRAGCPRGLDWACHPGAGSATAAAGLGDGGGGAARARIHAPLPPKLTRPHGARRLLQHGDALRHNHRRAAAAAWTVWRAAKDMSTQRLCSSPVHGNAPCVTPAPRKMSTSPGSSATWCR